MTSMDTAAAAQSARNARLVAQSPLLGARIESAVLPFRLDPAAGTLGASEALALAALEKTAAAIAIASLGSLAKAGDIDHLGGALELIPALLMTLGIVDYGARFGRLMGDAKSVSTP
jgi:hypothetical protein